MTKYYKVKVIFTVLTCLVIRLISGNEINSFNVQFLSNEAIKPIKLQFTFWKNDSVSTNELEWEINGNEIEISLPLVGDSLLKVIGFRYLYTVTKCELFEGDTLCETSSSWRYWSIYENELIKKDEKSSKLGCFNLENINEIPNFMIDCFLDSNKNEVCTILTN
jgi:hypothetical protein